VQFNFKSGGYVLQQNRSQINYGFCSFMGMK